MEYDRRTGLPLNKLDKNPIVTCHFVGTNKTITIVCEDFTDEHLYAYHVKTPYVDGIRQYGESVDVNRKHLLYHESTGGH